MKNNSNGKLELIFLQGFMVLLVSIIFTLLLFVYPGLLSFYPSLQPQIQPFLFLFLFGIYSQSILWLLLTFVFSQILTRIYVLQPIRKELKRMSILLLINGFLSLFLLPLVYFVADVDDAPGLVLIAGVYVLFHLGLYMLCRFLCKSHLLKPEIDA